MANMLQNCTPQNYWSPNTHILQLTGLVMEKVGVISKLNIILQCEY